MKKSKLFFHVSSIDLRNQFSHIKTELYFILVAGLVGGGMGVAGALIGFAMQRILDSEKIS